MRNNERESLRSLDGPKRLPPSESQGNAAMGKDPTHGFVATTAIVSVMVSFCSAVRDVYHHNGANDLLLYCSP